MTEKEKEREELLKRLLKNILEERLSRLEKRNLQQANDIKFEKEARNDLELITNFNYKAGFCCVELKKDQEAIKYFNKIINILNEHGRLPNDLENIYQKCSFEKERIMKKGEVEDKEFSKSRFLPLRYSIGVLIIIIIIYFILKMNGY